jgi:SAM-dependent methyltransferase
MYKIVELGAGTGKFTQCFSKSIGNLHNAKFQYTATEPSSGFRESLQSKTFPPFVTIQEGTGNTIPVKSGTQHMVVAAQAFHWMASEDTLKEIHRVLLPGGTLVLIWNTYDYSPANQWMREIDDQILAPAYAVANTPRQQSENWRQCFFGDNARNWFSPIHSWYSPYEHKGDRDLIVNRLFSTSVIVQQDQATRAKSKATLTKLLDTHPQLATARETGRFHVPYVTQVSWVVKK